MALSEKRKQAIRATFTVIDGYVWCDRTGGVHNDSLDPHGYGGDQCAPENHSLIYKAAEGKVG